MSEYWTPSGSYFSVSNTPVLVTSVTSQIEGVARIVNIGATAASVGFVSASGSIGAANTIAIESGAEFYVAFAAIQGYICATGATCLVNPGYALKDKTGSVS